MTDKKSTFWNSISKKKDNNNLFYVIHGLARNIQTSGQARAQACKPIWVVCVPTVERLFCNTVGIFSKLFPLFIIVKMLFFQIIHIIFFKDTNLYQYSVTQNRPFSIGFNGKGPAWEVSAVRMLHCASAGAFLLWGQPGRHPHYISNAIQPAVFPWIVFELSS